jgi:3-hydroxyisobutyrate dehydrogenase-like beta-hydroxyacid dehydrogenase
MARIAFCGLGQMGLPMALRLVNAGHEVTVWNRTAAKARPALARGAAAAESPAGAARGAEVAITMLSTPEAVEEVVFGRGGLVEGLRAGSSYLEMSTVGPEVVREAATRLPPGVEVFDAPVLGSLPQAEEGTLKIFVGGSSAEAARRLFPVLEVMGTPRYLGSLGSGASMKLVVNSTLVALMTALGEALALGDALGLDQADLLDVLADSPIGVPARGKRERIETGVYPPNFKLALAAKDARLVTEAAMAIGLDLSVAMAGRRWMEAANDAGLGELDYSAVVAHQRRREARLPG